MDKKDIMKKNIDFLNDTKIGSLESDFLTEGSMGFKIASLFTDLGIVLNETFTIESYLLRSDKDLKSNISRVMVWNDKDVFSFTHDNIKSEMLYSTIKNMIVKEINVIYKQYYANLLDKNYLHSNIDNIEILLEGESDTRVINKSSNFKELLKSLYKSIE